jgi:regulator of protease activity HflC (stomatin/prohibitin superfamily)
MTDQRRGKRLALAATVLQAAFCVVALVVWMWTGSRAAMSALWLLAAGAPLGLMTAFLSYCRQLERREALEIEEIAAQGGAQGTIFERGEELQKRPAARRLAAAEKWGAPAFTLLWAGIQVASAALIVRSLLSYPAWRVADPGPAAVLLVVVALAAFLFSNYCLGMARDERWRILRAAGSYLLVNSLVLGAAVVGFLVAFWRQTDRVDAAVAWAVPVVQVLLAAELVLNFILDLYRPRLPGQERRFGFDSRLLNLVAEPGRVGHSIAETLNYQFGFEVSKTWFYQLVSRAIVPLLVAGAAILLVMSSMVIVRDGEACVLRRWGRLEGSALSPGPHWKWPWPVETVERYEPGRIHQFLLGAGRERTKEEVRSDYIRGLEVADWSRAHGKQEELDFLIAVPESRKGLSAAEQQQSSPVHIIKMVVLVQYTIRDLREYAYRFVDPRKMLECLAYRELTHYFATATLDSPAEGGAEAGDRPEAIMTYGRPRAEAQLKKRVQEAADRMGLGVDIAHVAFVGVHPPPKSAPDFEKVFQAQREMEQKRLEAEANAAIVLTQVAGSPGAALQLALAIQQLDELTDLQEVRADPNQFQARWRKYLGDANERIRALGEEVEQERMEGRHRPDRLTSRQEVLQANQEYRRVLEGLAPSADLGALASQASARADSLLALASGKPASKIAAAQAERWEKEMRERGRWEALAPILAAYSASPRVFQWDHWLEVWEQTLPNMHKYILAVDRNRLEIWLDWHREPSALETVYQKPPQK